MINIKTILIKIISLTIIYRNNNFTYQALLLRLCLYLDLVHFVFCGVVNFNCDIKTRNTYNHTTNHEHVLIICYIEFNDFLHSRITFAIATCFWTVFTHFFVFRMVTLIFLTFRCLEIIPTPIKVFDMPSSKK